MTQPGGRERIPEEVAAESGLCIEEESLGTLEINMGLGGQRVRGERPQSQSLQRLSGLSQGSSEP